MDIVFDKISQNYAFYEYTLTRLFLHEIHICDEKSAKSYGFHENAKIIENHSFLLIV